MTCMIFSRTLIILFLHYRFWIRSRRSRRKSYASRKQSLESLFSTATESLKRTVGLLKEPPPQRLALKFPMVIHKGVIFEHMSPVGYIFIVATVSVKFTRVHLHICYAVSPVIRRNYRAVDTSEAKVLRLC